jgi:serine/threonine protein kinase
MAADVWSLGVILLTILTGSHPFQDANEAFKLQRIDEARVDFDECVGADARDLISKLIRRKPEERLSVEEIWNHRWVQRHMSSTDGLVHTPKEYDLVCVNRVFTRMEELQVDIPKCKHDLAEHKISSETATYQLLYNRALIAKKEEDAAAEIAARANSLCSLIGSPARINRTKGASPWATPVCLHSFPSFSFSCWVPCSVRFGSLSSSSSSSSSFFFFFFFFFLLRFHSLPFCSLI